MFPVFPDRVITLWHDSYKSQKKKTYDFAFHIWSELSLELVIPTSTYCVNAVLVQPTDG